MRAIAKPAAVSATFLLKVFFVSGGDCSTIYYHQTKTTG